MFCGAIEDVFHIQCHLEDTTLKPARRWLEQIPDLVASCLTVGNRLQPVVGTVQAGGGRGQIHARALSLLWWHQSERGDFMRLARRRLRALRIGSRAVAASKKTWKGCARNGRETSAQHTETSSRRGSSVETVRDETT